MKITKWSEYDIVTGEFTGRYRSTSASDAREFIAANTMPGFDFCEGEYEPGYHRIVVADRAKRIIEQLPLKPGDDYELNPLTRRWVKTLVAEQREGRRIIAQSRIEALERKMLRRVREALAEQDPQIKAIDQEIAALRSDLQRP